MTRNQSNEREQLEIEMLTIDQLVPEDHLVRKLGLKKLSMQAI